MRLALALVSLFAISCSTSNKYIFHSNPGECCPAFVDVGTDDGGMPDRSVSPTDSRKQKEAFGFVALEDFDGEELPDQRTVEREVVDDEGEDEPGFEVRQANANPRNHRDRNERLERALEDLQRAIENVRRAMR